MLKRMFLGLLLFLPVAAFAQTAAIENHCFLGGTAAKTSGLASSNYLNGIIPHCTVSVYLTGTQTLATIYSSSTSTPLFNPFLANTLASANPGGWVFWAAVNQGYDIVMSGGDPPNTYPQPVTLLDQFPGFEFSGTGGGCGPLANDATSTNCGTNNLATPPTGPAYLQAFGNNNLNNNLSTHNLAAGDTNLNGLTSLDQGYNIGLGSTNIGVATGEIGFLTSVGFNNFQNVAWANDDVAVGQANFLDNAGTSISNAISESVAIGLANVQYVNSGSTVIGIGQANSGGIVPGGSNNISSIVGIGDSAASLMGSNVDDVVAIGDRSAFTIVTGSHDIVAVGDGADKQCQTLTGCTPALPNPVLVNDVVALGDGPLTFNQGHDVVGIGNAAMGSNTVGAAAGYYNQGAFNIAIGSFSLIANSTGANNVALGAYAGADGFVAPNTWGNTNKTGSNNTWLGYDSGPHVTTQLSNTVALGYQAANDASNQIVLGNASVTQFRVPAVKAASGTDCLQVDASGNITNTGAACGSGAPLTTKGDIYGFSTVSARIPVGSNGQVLTADSTQSLGVKWGSLTGPTVNGTLCPLSSDCTVPTGANIYGLWGFGTSIVYGAGATSPGQTSFMALLGGITAAPVINDGQSSTTIAQDAVNVLTEFASSPVLRSATLFESGENDSNPCGSPPSNCTISVQNQYMAIDAWLSIPGQYRMMASASTSTTGTWGDGGSFDVYQPTLTTPFGQTQTTSTSGSSKTFDIPSSASPVVGVTFGVAPSGTGTFTVSVDGTLVTDNCSNSTTFTSVPCGGEIAASDTFYREEWVVTPNTTHTVVITSTNSAAVNIIGVDWIPPAGYAATNTVLHAGVLPNWASYTSWNPVAQTVVSKLATDGLPVYYVDTVNGTPGVNTTTDIATSATTLCPATILANHPNDCGNLHYFQTIVNTMIANNLNFGQTNLMGPAFVNRGQLQSAITIGPTPSTSKFFSVLGYNPNNPLGVGVLLLNQFSNQTGWGFGQDASTGEPWSGGYMQRMFGSPTTKWFCGAELPSGSNLDTQSSFTASWCVDVTTGKTYQLGAASVPSLVLGSSQAVSAVQGNAATLQAATGGFTSGDIPEYDASGNLANTGIPAANLASLANSNTWTGNQIFQGTVEVEQDTSVANNIASTSSVNQPCYTFLQSGTYWTGVTSSIDSWTWSCVYGGSGANPATILTLTHSGSSGAASVGLPNLTTSLYTVSSGSPHPALPAASFWPAGTQVIVTDSASYTPGVCAGGGSDVMIAVTDGSSVWSCH